MVELALVPSVQARTAPRPIPRRQRDDAPELIDLFHQYFELAPANTPQLLDEVYQLRYQVYCVENEFEDPAQNPGLRERDEFDAHSVHWLLRHRPSGTLAGAVRMVLPRLSKLEASFPMQQVCDLDLLKSKYPDFRLQRAAEVSRFCISRRFRRRIGETRYPDMECESGVDGQPIPIRERRIMPHITLGLMKATVQIGLDHGVHHFISVMDPAFLRLLNRSGVDWRPFGPQVEYHGRRLPCHGRLNDLVIGLRRRNRAFGDFVAGGRYLPE